MPSPQSDKIIHKILDLLKENGIEDHIVCFRDPDSPYDIIETAGSQFWCRGVAMDLSDMAKENRRKERELEED